MKNNKFGRMILVVAIFTLLFVAILVPPAKVLAAREAPLFQAPIYSVNLTPAVIAAVVGALISFGFTYIPGLNTCWAALKKEKQQLAMVGMMLLVTIVIMALGCYNVIITNLTCDQNGVLTAILIFFGAATGNQVAFRLSPQPAGVQTARLSRE
jgi:hypothetical protein